MTTPMVCMPTVCDNWLHIKLITQCQTLYKTQKDKPTSGHRNKRTDARNRIRCILAVKCDIWWQYLTINDFPGNQLVYLSVKSEFYPPPNVWGALRFVPPIGYDVLGDWKRDTWHRETGHNAAPYRKGGHRETCFSVRVDAHYKFMFYSGSIIWVAHRFMS